MQLVLLDPKKKLADHGIPCLLQSATSHFSGLLVLFLSFSTSCGFSLWDPASYVVLAGWGLTAFSPSVIQVNTHCQLTRLSGCQPGKSSPFLVPSALLRTGDGVVLEGLKVAPYRGRVWLVAKTSIFTIPEFSCRVVLQTVWLLRNNSLIYIRRECLWRTAMKQMHWALPTWAQSCLLVMAECTVT